MTNTPDVGSEAVDFVVILSRRVDRKAIQERFAASTGSLSALNYPLQTMPKLLVGLEL